MLKPRFLAALALALAFAAFATPTLHAQTGVSPTIPVQGTTFIDQNGAPLAAGKITFTLTDANDNPISYTVQGGSPSTAPIVDTIKNGTMATTVGGIQFTIPNPATTTPAGILYRMTITDPTGATVYLNLPRTQITGALYSYNSYVVPSGYIVSGIGNPRVPCSPGGIYNDTTTSGANPWVCSINKNDKTYIWTQNPSSSPQCGVGFAYAQPRTGAPFCLDSSLAYAMPGYAYGSPSTGNTPGPIGLNPISASSARYIDQAPFNAVCDGATPTDAAWSLAKSSALAIAAASSDGLCPATMLPNTANYCAVSSRIVWPSQCPIVGQDTTASGIIGLNGVGSNDLFSLYSAPGLNNLGGGFYDFTLSGSGSGTTGKLLQLNTVVGWRGIGLRFMNNGGGGVHIANSERLTIRDLTFQFVNWPITMWGSPNEIYLGGKLDIGYPGGTQAYGTNPICNYSLNATACAYPAPPALIQPINTYGAISVADADDLNVEGPVSIKSAGGLLQINNSGVITTEGASDMPAIHVQSGNNISFTHVYGEQGGASVIAGGGLTYATTTAPFPATAYQVSVDNIDRQIRTFGDCTDPVGSFAFPQMWIGPPDYCPAGSIDKYGNACTPMAVSSIDTGSGTILKGMSEVTGTSGYCKQPVSRTPTFTSGISSSINRGLAGGCSDPSVSPCVSHAAINWPAGAKTANLMPSAGPNVKISDSHLNRLVPANYFTAGYAYAPDDSGCKSLAEVVFGYCPDFLQVRPGTPPPVVTLSVNNTTMFNDGTHGLNAFQPLGEFLCHGTCILNFQNRNTGGVPTASNDNVDVAAYASSYFGYGPGIVTTANYVGGNSACLYFTANDVQRTYGSNCKPNNNGVSELQVSPIDPASLTTYHGKEVTGTYGFFFHSYTALPVIPTFSNTGGSLGSAGTPQYIETREQYVAPQVQAVGGGYVQTLVSGGSGYSGTSGPQAIIGSTNSTQQFGIVSYSITNATVGGNTVSTIAGTANEDIHTLVSTTPGATNNLIGFYGFTGAPSVRGMNGQFIALNTVSGANFSGTVVGGSSPPTTGTQTDPGFATISPCPLWVGGLSTNSSGQVTGIGDQLAAPGVCNVAPGTVEPIEPFLTSTSSTGSGAQINVTVQGTYSWANKPVITAVPAGVTTGSLTVGSPAADTNGVARFWNECGGPPGNSYQLQSNIAIGSPAAPITTLTTAPTYPAQTGCPNDAGYNQMARSRCVFYGNIAAAGGSTGFGCDVLNPTLGTYTPLFKFDYLTGFNLNQPLVLGGSPGAFGNVPVSQGPGLPPLWGTAGGGSGTITAVTAGTGLTGGGTSGAVSVALAGPINLAVGGAGGVTGSLPGTQVSGAVANATTAANATAAATLTVPYAESSAYLASPSNADNAPNFTSMLAAVNPFGVPETGDIQCGTYHIKSGLVIAVGSGGGTPSQTLKGHGLCSILDIGSDYSPTAGPIISVGNITNSSTSQAGISDLMIQFHYPNDFSTTASAAVSAGATTIPLTDCTGVIAGSPGSWMTDQTNINNLSNMQTSPSVLGSTHVTARTGSGAGACNITIDNPVLVGFGTSDVLQFAAPISSDAPLGTCNNAIAGSGYCEYPLAIDNEGGQSFYIRHVVVAGAYQGIKQRGQTYDFSGIDISAWKVGLDQDGSANSSVLANFSVWNYVEGKPSDAINASNSAMRERYFSGDPTAFNLGRNDETAFSDIHSYAIKGYLLPDFSYASADNWIMDGSGADLFIGASTAGCTGPSVEITHFKSSKGLSPDTAPAVTSYCNTSFPDARFDLKNTQAAGAMGIAIHHGYNKINAFIQANPGVPVISEDGGWLDLTGTNIQLNGSCTALTSPHGMVDWSGGALRWPSGGFVNNCPGVVGVNATGASDQTSNWITPAWNGYTFTPPAPATAGTYGFLPSAVNGALATTGGVGRLASAVDLTPAAGGTDIGAPNAYVVALTPAIVSYPSNLAVRVQIGAGNTNTGASTLNLGGGALPIMKKTPNGLVVPAAGELAAGNVVEFDYDAVSAGGPYFDFGAVTGIVDNGTSAVIAEAFGAVQVGGVYDVSGFTSAGFPGIGLNPQTYSAAVETPLCEIVRNGVLSTGNYYMAVAHPNIGVNPQTGSLTTTTGAPVANAVWRQVSTANTVKQVDCAFNIVNQQAVTLLQSNVLKFGQGQYPVDQPLAESGSPYTTSLKGVGIGTTLGFPSGATRPGTEIYAYTPLTSYAGASSPLWYQPNSSASTQSYLYGEGIMFNCNNEAGCQSAIEFNQVGGGGYLSHVAGKYPVGTSRIIKIGDPVSGGVASTKFNMSDVQAMSSVNEPGNAAMATVTVTGGGIANGSVNVTSGGTYNAAVTLQPIFIIPVSATGAAQTCTTLPVAAPIVLGAGVTSVPTGTSTVTFTTNGVGCPSTVYVQFHSTALQTCGIEVHASDSTYMNLVPVGIYGTGAVGGGAGICNEAQSNVYIHPHPFTHSGIGIWDSVGDTSYYGPEFDKISGYGMEIDQHGTLVRDSIFVYNSDPQYGAAGIYFGPNSSGSQVHGSSCQGQGSLGWVNFMTLAGAPEMPGSTVTLPSSTTGTYANVYSEAEGFQSCWPSGFQSLDLHPGPIQFGSGTFTGSVTVAGAVSGGTVTSNGLLTAPISVGNSGAMTIVPPGTGGTYATAVVQTGTTCLIDRCELVITASATGTPASTPLMGLQNPGAFTAAVPAKCNVSQNYNDQQGHSTTTNYGIGWYQSNTLGAGLHINNTVALAASAVVVVDISCGQ